MLYAGSVSAAPGPAERETARSLMQEGDRLRNAGDLSNALQRYQAAHALMQVPTTGLAVAETQAQLGLLVEARSSALDASRVERTPGEPHVFTSARDAAALLAGALEPRICTLKTHVKPASAQYTVQIDDLTLPAAARAVPFKTNPGHHVIRVRAPGFEALTRELTLREGVHQQVELELVAAPQAAAELQPAAEQPSLTPGQAAYAAQIDGRRQSGRVRGLIGLSVGGISLAAGIVTGLLSWKQTMDIKNHCAADKLCDAAQSGAISQANTLGHVANITVPLGVVGIAYGLFELLTLPDAPADSESAALRFEIAPNGVVLRGTL